MAENLRFSDFQRITKTWITEIKSEVQDGPRRGYPVNKTMLYNIMDMEWFESEKKFFPSCSL